MYARRFVQLALGIVAPTLVALIYVHRFGVNVPVHDEWHFMAALDDFYSGHHWPHDLVEHYGEHRIPVAKAIILALAPFTKYNVKVEMYLAAILMAAGAFVVWRLLGQTGASRWLIVPIGWLFVSTAQYHNLLVGWQFQIPLMNVFVLLTVLRLSKSQTGLRDHILAAATAFAATFSFANGLLIWPTMVFWVGIRHRNARITLTWVALTILAVFLYFWGYSGFHRNPADQTPDYVQNFTRAPSTAVGLFFANVGNNFGGGSVEANIVAGVVVMALLAAIVIPRWRSKFNDTSTASPYADPWLALALFSLFSAVAIGFGRTEGWRQFATASRYITVTVFMPIAILVLGDRRVFSRTTRGFIRVVAASLVVVAIAQHTRTVLLGWTIGQAAHNQMTAAVPCVLNYRAAPRDCLLPLYVRDDAYVRQNASILERWRLGPFANSPAPRPISADVDLSLIGAVEGTIDAVQIEPQTSGTVVVNAQGWSLIAKRLAPATVALFIDGNWVGQTATFVNRADVATFFKRVLPPVGWTIRSSDARLDKGRHQVTILVISSHGVVLGGLPPVSIVY